MTLDSKNAVAVVAKKKKKVGFPGFGGASVGSPALIQCSPSSFAQLWLVIQAGFTCKYQKRM